MARRGRPTIPLTAEALVAIVDAVSNGCNRIDAAQAAGICQDTLRTWMRRGAMETDTDYSYLFQEVRKAAAQAIVRYVGYIDKAAKSGDAWQAAAWWLERTQPKKYGQNAWRIIRLEKQLRELEEREAARQLPPAIVQRIEAAGVIEHKPAANGNGVNGHGTNGHNNGTNGESH